MAVYTEVAAEDTRCAFGALRHRRTRLLQGHRRGGREQQFLPEHGPGAVHPDALRKARLPGRSAVLPWAYGAPRQERRDLPDAGPRPGGQGVANRRGQARGNGDLSYRLLAAKAPASALPRAWRGTRHLARSWPDVPAAAPERPFPRRLGEALHRDRGGGR